MRVRSSTDPAQIYELLTEQWGLAPPHLVVALVGGDELAQMKPWLRDTVRKGLVKAAQSTGTTHSQNFSFKLHCLLHCSACTSVAQSIQVSRVNHVSPGFDNQMDINSYM